MTHFFSPPFLCCRDLFYATHFPLTCVHETALHSPPGPQPACGLPACLPANCRKDDTNPVCLGLVRFGPEPVIYSADCGGCGSNHPNLTHHQSALNIDRVDFLTFESNLLHSNVPILPSLCPPSPLRLFFFASFLLQIVFPLSLIIRTYEKNDFH